MDGASLADDPVSEPRLVRSLAVSLAVTALVGFAVCGLAVAADDEPELLVELEADGDATVTYVSTHDLSNEDERAAFESIRDDATARAAFGDRFADRLDSVATDASESTDRQMAVSDPTVTVSTTADGSVGILRIEVVWTNLAAAGGNELVVTEPFASGFTPDRSFTVVVPEGFELTTVEPEPGDRHDDRATWTRGDSLDGFELRAQSVDGDAGEGGNDDGERDDGERDDGNGDLASGGAGGVADDGTHPSGEDGSGGPDARDDSIPGFGVGTGLLALLLGASVRARRSRNAWSGGDR